MSAVLVVAGAMVGAPLRYLLDRAVQARHDSVFPWGTLVVNVLGSFVLGSLVAGVDAGGVPPGLATALGAGLCGAFTTYSTFGYETLRLAEGGAFAMAGLNVMASVVAGLGAAFGGGAVAYAIVN